MKKILYIDVWKNGYRNFTRIDNSLKLNGFITILVHTGSFYDKEIIIEEIIDNLLVRDIVYYKTIFLKKVIEIEKPDLILILNLSFVFDRTIVNICKSNFIKLAYLAHGNLTAPELVSQETRKINKNKLKNFNKIISKKNILIILNYISSLKGKKLILNPINLFFGLLKQPSNYLLFANHDIELDADLLMVYTTRDKDLLNNTFKFPKDKIKIIGNPEITFLMNHPLLPRRNFLLTLGLSSNFKYVVYLEDGLLADGVFTEQTWFNHLLEILEILNYFKYKLIIKLHPRTKVNNNTSFFTKNNILCVQEADFKNLIFHSEFVLSNYSSTIIYSLILNRKVFVPHWGDLELLVKNYPENVVDYCYSKKELLNKIEVGFEINQDKVFSFLLENGINSGIDSIKNITCEISKLL